MLRDKRKYTKFFFIIFSVSLLISLMVVEKTSVFEVEVLRRSWFGNFWDEFLFPGAIIVMGPIVFIYDFFSPFLRCPGTFSIDRFCEPYFSYAGLSMISALYAAILTGAVYGIDRVRYRQE